MPFPPRPPPATTRTYNSDSLVSYSIWRSDRRGCSARVRRRPAVVLRRGAKSLKTIESSLPFVAVDRCALTGRIAVVAPNIMEFALANSRPLHCLSSGNSAQSAVYEAVVWLYPATSHLNLPIEVFIPCCVAVSGGRATATPLFGLTCLPIDLILLPCALLSRPHGAPYCGSSTSDICAAILSASLLACPSSPQVLFSRSMPCHHFCFRAHHRSASATDDVYG
ncbi:hypothetical protein FA95DRAFT_1211096 [Auriscalpium vulgare]|uniref:Uncharacterized protein n=1 Tax=Auriscalpium vulgare TaxID=40419 RepID=A0ACB8RUF4_9AGAM|nr:hypothetical protein FA95DRAFT_1211096 [Auriscalpium vulgare]